VGAGLRGAKIDRLAAVVLMIVLAAITGHYDKITYSTNSKEFKIFFKNISEKILK